MTRDDIISVVMLCIVIASFAAQLVFSLRDGTEKNDDDRR